MNEIESLTQKAKSLQGVLRELDQGKVVEALERMINSVDIMYKTRDEHRELFPKSDSSDEEWIKTAIDLIMRKS